MANSLQALLGLQRQIEPEMALPNRRLNLRREMARNLGFQRQDPTRFGTGATEADLSALDEDIAADPLTGVEAHARNAATQGRLDEEAAYMSPGATEVREDQEASALRKLLLPVAAKAQADASVRNEGYAQQLLRDRLNNADIGARQTATAAATSERAAGTRQAQGERQLTADRLMRARGLETEARKTRGTGFMDWLTGRPAKLQQEASQLRGGMPGMSDAQEAALVLSQQYPGVPLEDLISRGFVEVDTPEDFQQLQAAFAALQNEEF